jgi:site-specific DNA recombinase
MLAKRRVRLVSITQEAGDDPVQVMMRQVIALFDEYQSKENAKHALRSVKENARQGYWMAIRRSRLRGAPAGSTRSSPSTR